MKRGLLLIGVLVFAGPGRAAEKVDFSKQIMPILQNTCVKCHGPEKQKAKLRLDTPEAILKGGKEKVLVPGKPEESKLYELIALPPNDPDIMPADGDPLTKEQIALVKEWIAQGASFEGWSAAPAEKLSATSQPAMPDLLSTMKVPAADPKAVEALTQKGALVLPIAAGTNLLTISWRDIPADALGLLKAVARQVTWLDLAGTKIDDAGVANLAPLANLTRLHLERTAVTDAGLAHLGGLKHLQYLNLYATTVTDAGLAHLKGLPELRRLYLWETKVSDAGAAELKKTLPNLDVNRGFVPAQSAPAADPAPAAPPAQAAADDKPPINTACPISGAAASAQFFVVHKGQKIAFCCDKCRDQFAKDPEKFIAKVKEFKNPA